MSDKAVDLNSPWKVEVDLEQGQIRRVRNFSRKDGIPALPLEKKLREVFMGIAGGIFVLGEEFSSTVIENKAAELAYGWARVAQESEKVRIFLTWAVTTNAWADAAVPTGVVVAAIAWRTGMLPEGFIASIGERAAKFSGAIPLSKEEEEDAAAAVMKMMSMAVAEQEQELTHEDMEPEPGPEPEVEPARTEPEPEDKPINADGPRIVSLPPDADLD